jgi:putative SOS response-associated peptidase YedK
MSHEQPPTNVPASGYAMQITEKPAFRQAFAKRRTVLPANGYYEWAPEEIDGKIRKQPYYMPPRRGWGAVAGRAVRAMGEPLAGQRRSRAVASDGHDHHHGRHRTRGRDYLEPRR